MTETIFKSRTIKKGQKRFFFVFVLRDIALGNDENNLNLECKGNKLNSRKSEKCICRTAFEATTLHIVESITDENKTKKMYTTKKSGKLMRMSLEIQSIFSCKIIDNPEIVQEISLCLKKKVSTL